MRKTRYVSKGREIREWSDSSAFQVICRRRERIMGTYSLILIGVAAVILVVALIMKKTKA
jgi:hypothetical protein